MNRHGEDTAWSRGRAEIPRPRGPLESLTRVAPLQRPFPHLDLTHDDELVVPDAGRPSEELGGDRVRRSGVARLTLQTRRDSIGLCRQRVHPAGGARASGALKEPHRFAGDRA